MNRFWATYGKAILATVLAVFTAVQAAVSDHHITPVEWVQIATATATAVGVYLAPVAPGVPYAKSDIAALLAALQVAGVEAAGGWSHLSWPAIVLAALTALGVAAAPAGSPKVTTAVAGKVAAARAEGKKA